MIELFPFFIVLFAGVFFSELFFRFNFPWVIALILGGILIGPSFLGIFESNSTIDFLGNIGLVFLMFMAGLESNLLRKDFFKKFDDFFRVAMLSSVIPFILGFLVIKSFGFSDSTSIFMGVIFISSSIAAIVPSLESKGLLHCKIGKNIISTVIISDVLSLISLSIVLQTVEPQTKLPLILFYILLFAALIFLKWIIPKVRWFFKNEVKTAKDVFHQELRSIFVIMIGVVLIFELLGLHPIIAGFFAGLVLSNSIKSNIVRENIRALSYGIFIPIFFVVIGSKTDFHELFSSYQLVWLTVVLTTVAVLSKLISGYFGGISIGLSKKESLILGSSTVPQLSTTLAVAFAGLELGILNNALVTSLVTLSIITTIIGAFLIRLYSRDYVRDEVETHIDRVNNHYV